MKKLIGLFGLMIISLLSFSQEIQQRNVPAVVLNTFQLKFPNADNVTWKLEKGNYRVSFETNDKDNELQMNDKGIVLSHTRDLYASEIPGIVLETIKSRIAFFDLGDAEIREEGGQITYTINTEINDKKNEFLIDEHGKLLKYDKELKDREVPLQIMDMIRVKFGSLDIDEAWLSEVNGKITYIIKGEISDKDHSFVVDNNSNLIKHEQELKISEVPLQILNAAISHYNGYEIKNADLKEEGGKITYYLDLRRSREKVIVMINSEGSFLGVTNRK